MQIDWLTVAAQVVNFLVLVWLLRRFLYGPITRAMARRQDRIEATLAEAADERHAAEAARLAAARAELAERREEILDAARTEADALGERLKAELSAEIAERRKAWLAELADERESFLAEFRRRAAEHVQALARGVLGELADADLDAAVARRFAAMLDTVPSGRLAKLAEAARAEGGRLTVASASDLAPAVETEIAEALRRHVMAGVQPVFTRDPGLLAGLRVEAGGQVLEWALAAHLRRLDKAVAVELDHAPGAQAAA